ncbi:MAG: flagellar biosynthesis anti-sigma factor FlgM [bacterium]|nr:flagellar biosynthesis anti-sigma factor FlgM [bacterium]
MGEVIGVNAFFRLLPVEEPHSKTGVRRATGREEERPGRPMDSADRIEFSTLGNLLSAVGETPEARLNRVETIRESITAGTYETPSKIDATVEHIMRQLGR